LQHQNKKALTDLLHLKDYTWLTPSPLPNSSTSPYHIIGADHYWDVVEDHIIRGNGLTAMGSKLGYLLSEIVGAATPRNMTVNILYIATQSTTTVLVSGITWYFSQR